MSEMSPRVKEAYEEWQKLNANAAEREAAEERFLELVSNEYGKAYERRLGREEGEKRGEKRGKKQALVETAKKMLEEKIDIDMIVRITGLTKEEIEKLKV